MPDRLRHAVRGLVPNLSQERHGDYLEYKMTGSLYGIRNVHKPIVKDD